MEMYYKQQTLTIINKQHTCSDDVFASLHISKKTRYLCYQTECVCINHRIIKQNVPIQADDRIDIFMHVVEEDNIIPCFQDLHVLYEDELFLIVNKPAHMIVHSDGVSSNTTLYDIVKGYYMNRSISCPVRAIHRLDKETSGAVIFCKIPLLQPFLDHMLEQKLIERQYWAICSGVFDKKEFTIQSKIGKDRHHASRMRISTSGKDARTDIHVLTQYTDYALVECHLQTGRTHQIRVHLASIMHPILHDYLYGNHDIRIQRVALHAVRVKLQHPLRDKQIIVECPLPVDIKSLLK